MNRILNFHEVYDYQWFDSLVGFLSSKYKMVSLDAINTSFYGDIHLKNACHITVDDGEKSFVENIFPIMKKYNVPVTLFVSPKIITNNLNYWFQEIRGYNPIYLTKIISDITGTSYELANNCDPVWILKTLTITEILEIIKKYQSANHTSSKKHQNICWKSLVKISQSELVTIGAHTMNHPILKNESGAESNFEISESVNELSNLLGYKIKYFAYPNGKRYLDFTNREEEILKKNDVQLAVTTEPGNLASNNDKMRVPRIGIPDGQKLPIVKLKLMLGSHLNSIRKLKVSEEVKQRNRITRKFSTS